MNLNEYAEWTDQTWKSGELATEMSDVDTAITALGLAGEAGEVTEHFKKFLRDGKPLIGNEAVAYELGDVLYYWARLCRRIGLTPQQVLDMNVSKLNARHAARRAERGIAA